MNKGFTLVEIIIVVAMIVLMTAMIIPNIVKVNKDAIEKEAALFPMDKNDLMLKAQKVEKMFELEGYDVYTFRDKQGNLQSVAIPVKESVYDLERR